MLNRYNKALDQFERINLPQQDFVAPNSSEIREIQSDKKGTLWVGTYDNGLFKIIQTKNGSKFQSVKQYKNEPENTNSLNYNLIWKIQIENEQTIWIGTTKGLNKFNPETEQFKHYTFDIKNNKAKSTNIDFEISSILSNDDGTLWLGAVSGLIHFNPKNETFIYYPHQYTVFRYGWGGIIKIVKDKKNNLWLATSAELMHFNTSTNTFTSFRNDPFSTGSISYNIISSVYIDATEILWVGTNGMGLNTYDPKAHRFLNIKRPKNANSRVAGFSIRAIYQENNRYLWLSSDVIYRWDKKTNSLQSFETSSNELNTFGNTGSWSITKTKDGLMWFATTEGLYKYNSALNTYVMFKYNPQIANGIPQKNISLVYEDSEENLWIATENFLSKMVDRNQGVFKHYRYSNLPQTNIYNRVTLYKDENKIIWLGTSNGLISFDETKNQFYYYKNDPENTNSIINNQIKCITPDPVEPEKQLWIGTSGGISILNKKDNSFTHITEKDGLPNNVVYAILPDQFNSLWISTNKGLSQLNYTKKTFRNFDVNDHLQSNEFNTGAYFKSQKGELFFGGIDGVTHFFPEQIIDNPYIPKISITSINSYSRLKNNTLETTKKILPLNPKETVVFSNKEDNIIFEFSSLDFSAPSKNEYAFMLKNYHKDWVYNHNSNTATFTNLPPGKYFFKVKSSNNDGIWNETGISIPIQILPHWTGTWWAFTAYGILLLILLLILRKYELKRFHVKNQLKFERIESESLRGLDKLKSQFFTNISHELRTPLTLIIGQIENLLEDIKNAKSRKQIKSIDSNTKRLLELINQMLDISKLEAGKMELYNTQQNLVPLLKNLFYAFESYAANKNITLHFKTENNNIQAVFDEEKIKKICINLISNAVKFTLKGGQISLQIKQTANHHIQIIVTDTGIGIPEKDLPYIFNRFYQVDHSDTRLYEGTGIGLAITKELAELHSGAITVEKNTIGKGTQFMFEFPAGELTKESKKIKNLAISKQYQYPETPNRDNGYKITVTNKKIILLVEDNAEIRQYIKDLLEEKYNIIEAENGEIGLAMAIKAIPDLILTDVMMPKIDGFTLVTHLKNDEKTSHIPIIILTGKANQNDKLTGLETGVDAYIYKPFSNKELHICIKNLLKKQEILKQKFKITTPFTLESDAVKNKDKQFLEKMFNHILNNSRNPEYSVEKLAEVMCLSNSQLHRKLQALTGQSPGEMIRKIKLQKAAELLKNNTGSIAEICFQTGFNDQAYFSRAFKNEFGCSPTAYKKELTS